MDAVKEDIKVHDLTAGELAKMIRQIIREELKPIEEYLYEIEEQMPDPDEGKTLKAEFIQDLEQRLQKPRVGKSLQQVSEELGLDE